MTYPTIQLQPNRERRIQAGHLWIFSNEINNSATPLKQFEPGSIVKVMSARNEALGLAYINSQCLLCARILTSDVDEKIDLDFFVRRIKNALRLRETFFAKPYYRLIYSEGDLLPGLIVDRYGDSLVIQINTAGMEKLRDLIVDALKSVIKPTRIVLRNDNSYRTIEGLGAENQVLLGDKKQPLLIEENNTKFQAPVMEGQKTGWFYDHQNNRSQLLPWVKGKRVLDVYSYLGAWGIACATHGASEVVCIDRSKVAVDFLAKNAELNNVTDTVSAIVGEAFRVLEQLIQEKELFDIVIIDPPAFIKSKKDIKQGIKGYTKLNRLALQLLKPSGLLLSASCSLHLTRDDLAGAVAQASSQTKSVTQIVYQGGQGYDHPIHPAISETNYLKTVFVRKAGE